MKKTTLLLLTVIISFLACGPKVTTDKMGRADLSSYDTFAYLPNSNFDAYEKFETDNNVGMSVIESVNQNMKNQGYSLDRSSPDLLVLLTTSTDMEKTITADPVYATYPAYYNRSYAVSPYYQNYYYNNYYDYTELVGYNTNLNRYKEGMLVLRLVDTETKQVVWEGKASDQIFRQNESMAISEFVDDMFDEFPVAK